MTSFISILQVQGDAASYRIRDNGDHTFTADLIKARNHSSGTWPSEITIDLHNNQQTADGQDLLVQKLISVVREAEVLNGSTI